jgi:prevent-host-death family protein
MVDGARVLAGFLKTRVKMNAFRGVLSIAIKCGYNEFAMEISVAEAKNRFSQLIRQMEEGEPILITRNGKPVAQLVPAPQSRRTVVLGGMRDRIRLLPGWDDPVDLDRFLQGDL